MDTDFSPVFEDMVRVFTQSEGIGPFVPGAAVPGHRGFQAISAGERFYYSVESITVPGEWEVGRGTMQGDGSVAREPLASSAGGGLVAFAAGTKTLALTVAAEFYRWALDRPDGGPLGVADGGTGASDAAGARHNLGLGSAATMGVGTSGAAVPVLNGGATTWAAGASFGGDVVASGQLRSSANIAGDHVAVQLANASSDAFANTQIRFGNNAGHIAGFFHNGSNKLADGGPSGLAFYNDTGALYYRAIGGHRWGTTYGSADVMTLTAAGIDVAAEVRCDSLRIDSAPTPSAAAATHKLAVSLNGETYYLLLSSA